jgi:hypothetical protein
MLFHVNKSVKKNNGASGQTAQLRLASYVDAVQVGAAR